MTKFVLLITVILSVFISMAAAQSLPRCDARPGWRSLPRVNPAYWCYEEVISETGAGEMPFTALAFAPDGRLFTTRPLYGQVWMLRDTDGDGQPDNPQVVADGLTLPNALVYHDGTLYIAGGNHLYRLPDGGELEILVEDLPAGAGYWTGGLAIGDGRMFVGIGAPCDFCEWDDPERGSILSFALDGSDRQLVARGFRHPTALLYYQGELYATDSSREAYPYDDGLDELNRIVPGGHYGFPYCLGLHNQPVMPDANFDCSQAIPSLVMLSTQSIPAAMAVYESDTFPHLTGKLLLVLAGSDGVPDVRGYQILAMDRATIGTEHLQAESVIPYDAATTKGAPPTYDLSIGLDDPDIMFLNRRGGGLWPHRIYGLAISPQGWIYFSVGGGKIASLRPHQ